jgi:hypothetical protein
MKPFIFFPNGKSLPQIKNQADIQRKALKKAQISPLPSKSSCLNSVTKSIMDMSYNKAIKQLRDISPYLIEDSALIVPLETPQGIFTVCISAFSSEGKDCTRIALCDNKGNTTDFAFSTLFPFSVSYAQLQPRCDEFLSHTNWSLILEQKGDTQTLLDITTNNNGMFVDEITRITNNDSALDVHSNSLHASFIQLLTKDSGGYDFDFYLERIVTLSHGTYCISLCHIDEGINGSYDLDDADDKPLLRFNIDQKVHGEWEGLDNASFCSQLDCSLSHEHGEKFIDIIEARIIPLVPANEHKFACMALTHLETSYINGNTVEISLWDDSEKAIHFTYKKDRNNAYRERGLIESNDGITMRAKIGDITINGDAWRDLECNDSINTFIHLCIIGNNDPDEYLQSIAKELGVTATGRTL